MAAADKAQGPRLLAAGEADSDPLCHLVKRSLETKNTREDTVPSSHGPHNPARERVSRSNDPNNLSLSTCTYSIVQQYIECTLQERAKGSTCTVCVLVPVPVPCGKSPSYGTSSHTREETTRQGTNCSNTRIRPVPNSDVCLLIEAIAFLLGEQYLHLFLCPSDLSGGA
jgi:hypothetical protein